jgi:hypothetical protein
MGNIALYQECTGCPETSAFMFPMGISRDNQLAQSTLAVRMAADRIDFR